MASNSRGIPGFSTEHWNSLLNSINNQANFDKLSGKIKSVGILDFRCSHYMTSRKGPLKNLQPTAPYIIVLPNGTEVIALEQGSVFRSKFYYS